MKKKLQWKKTNRSAYIAKWKSGTFLITKEGVKWYSLLYKGKVIADGCKTLSRAKDMAEDYIIATTCKP